MSIIRLKALGSQTELTNLDALSQGEKSLYPNQKNSYDNTISQYEFSIEELNSAIKSSSDEIERLELLLSKSSSRLKRLESIKDIIAYKELEELQKENLDIKAKLSIAKNSKDESIRKLNATKQELEVFKQNSKSKYLDELITKIKRGKFNKSRDKHIYISKQTATHKKPSIWLCRKITSKY